MEGTKYKKGKDYFEPDQLCCSVGSEIRGQGAPSPLVDKQEKPVHVGE